MLALTLNQKGAKLPLRVVYFDLIREGVEQELPSPNPKEKEWAFAKTMIAVKM